MKVCQRYENQVNFRVVFSLHTSAESTSYALFHPLLDTQSTVLGYVCVKLYPSYYIKSYLIHEKKYNTHSNSHSGSIVMDEWG